MSFRILIFALGIGCCCGDAFGASAAGYLRSIGPGPIRYLATPERTGKVLPPLPPDEPAPVVVTPPSAINPGGADALTRAGGDKEGGAPLVTPEGAPVTTEMLVEIFRSRWGEGRGRDERVIVPFGFVPPTSAPQSSSSATYEKQ
jgi:hypothetical protein